MEESEVQSILIMFCYNSNNTTNPMKKFSQFSLSKPEKKKSLMILKCMENGNYTVKSSIH